MHTILDAERVGPAYTEDGMLLARRKTREALAAIAARIRPACWKKTLSPWRNKCCWTWAWR
jgi:hypothetical protein